MLLGSVKKSRQYKIDVDLVNDLFLFMENTPEIMGSYERSFLPNIARKIGSGKFDENKLPKLMDYLYQNNRDIIRKYYGSVTLNKAEKELLAKKWSIKAINDIEYNYDQLYNGYTNKYESISKFTKGKKISGIYLGK